MKIIVDNTVAAGDVAQYIDVIEARLRAELPILKRIYIEIGSMDDSRAKTTGATMTAT